MPCSGVDEYRRPQDSDGCLPSLEKSNMAHPDPSKRRVYEIDSLRFIAALMVVMFHWAFRGGATHDYTDLVYRPLLPAAKYGYMGVELFFMISGFVILMSAQGRSVRQFAVSRIVRLYPAFWACCTISALAILAFGDPHFKIGLWKYLANMTMLSNFMPFDVQLVDGVYWSLFVEIRFYVFVALVVWLGWLPHTERLLWAWLGVSALLQLAPESRVCDWLIGHHAPLFIAGACCYRMHAEGMTRERLLLLAASLPVALYDVVVGAHDLDRRYAAYHLDAMWAAVLLAGFYLVMFTVATRGIGVLRYKAAVACGALTYPLYLLHEDIGFMIFNRLAGRLNTSLMFWGTMALLLLLAWSVHRFVEEPLSRPLKRLLERAFTGPRVRPVPLAGPGA